MGRRTRLRSVGLALLVVSALASAACAATTVNKIIADPSRYRDREVRVSGSVVDSYSFATRGAYKIDDGTGQLWVVTESGVPGKGARVTVTGTIREGFTLGSLGDRISLPPGAGSGVVMMESSHRTRD